MKGLVTFSAFLFDVLLSGVVMLTVTAGSALLLGAFVGVAYWSGNTVALWLAAQ